GMSELAPGTKAPAFTLPALDGSGDVDGPVRGPLTLLLFAKASCPTCRWVMPTFQTLHERTAGGSLHVLGIFQDDPDVERAAAAELGVTFPVAVEETPWAVAEAYGLTTVPTFYLLDEHGKVLVTSPGFSRDDLLEAPRRAADLDGGDVASPFPEGMEVPAYRPG
ncbi:TlpA family protein disulfide reductase, partial [bacterium]|nr:TlpA family protein disulfide reductase [bacterium]